MGLFRSVERFGVIRFQDQQWTNGERGIRTLGTDDPYYGLAIRRFGPLSHLSKMEKFLFNKMNGGVKVYTIACTDCIDNITNIAIIQLEKNESGELYFSFRFKRFCLFSDLPGLALTNHPCPFNFFFYVSFFGSLVLLYGMILFIVTEGYS